MQANTYYYPLKDGYNVGDIILADGIYHEIIEIDQVNQTMTIGEKEIEEIVKLIKDFA
tara:strand:+ start:844 stop:1017 length:174 start_codon:yes stop_codon:yes gene_type:complete